MLPLISTAVIVITPMEQAAIVWRRLVHVTKRHQPHEGLQLSRLERVKMSEPGPVVAPTLRAPTRPASLQPRYDNFEALHLMALLFI